MIAPFHFKKLKNRLLITNDLGQYDFLTPEEFEKFSNNRLEKEEPLYQRLEEERFVYDTSPEKFAEDIKMELRSGKSYLFSATSLHIFVVTNFCNGCCVYCQAQSKKENACKKMSFETAEKAVDLALQSPQRELTFEFQGGEPLSNFPVIRHIVEYAQKKAKEKEKKVHYSIVSNLSLLTEEMLAFLKEHEISISTSLDGNHSVHASNRPLADGRDSYEVLREKLKLLEEQQVSYGAIQTTTRKSLSCSQEIVEEYVFLGMHNVFLRPLTPLGYALERWSEIGYTTEEFLDFYRKSLEYLLELNKDGTSIKEGHAVIFLTKIFDHYGVNYMELRSPCGAAIGQMAYYYDGNVFTCDEGRMLYEMGDASFKIGNVETDTYDTLINSRLCRMVCKCSILESLPKCCDCAYQPYCGTCPVLNYALEKDPVSRKSHSYRCRIYEGMLDILFELLMEEDNREILRSWVE